MDRVDLSGLPAGVIAYIEALEARLAELEQPRNQPTPSEPPTSRQVITLTAQGLAKRTPRHLYGRQHRAGMGVFDLDTPPTDPPAALVVADESEQILLFSDQGRAFRLAVTAIPLADVRGSGQSVVSGLMFRPGEKIVAVLPDSNKNYVALVSERGWVRRIRSSRLSQRGLVQGLTFHDPKDGGRLVAACWSKGDDDLFIATRQGLAIRFPEHHVSDQHGCLGVRLEPGDSAAAIAAVNEESNIFLLGNDGKGTLRQMSTFRANKAPGAGAKQALKSDRLVAALTVSEQDDLFIISGLSKMIRFPAGEVPVKEGVVQGVNCMILRADEVVAATITPL